MGIHWPLAFLLILFAFFAHLISLFSLCRSWEDASPPLALLALFPPQRPGSLVRTSSEASLVSRHRGTRFFVMRRCGGGRAFRFGRIRSHPISSHVCPSSDHPAGSGVAWLSECKYSSKLLLVLLDLPPFRIVSTRCLP